MFTCKARVARRYEVPKRRATALELGKPRALCPIVSYNRDPAPLAVRGPPAGVVPLSCTCNVTPCAGVS